MNHRCLCLERRSGQSDEAGPAERKKCRKCRKRLAAGSDRRTARALVTINGAHNRRVKFDPACWKMTKRC
ncbi:hypothetical protein KCP74_24195 [Salmonella enterica subsp. enterica]|nr:hypothetical protein KCP74_24195 [Salmonella enterica subsp. enterica]